MNLARYTPTFKEEAVRKMLTRGERASDVMRDICLREGISPGQVVLHSDNGGPMKGATMLVTLRELGVAPSFSRPAVSDDNPLFGDTCLGPAKLAMLPEQV